MGKFTCTHCGVELKNRGHICGVQETPHKVEIIGGGKSWGNIRMGVSGTRDSSIS